MSRATRGFHGRQGKTDAPLPPGQYNAGREWPVLSAEITPNLDTTKWTFRVEGLVEREVTWTWDEIHALPTNTYEGAIHCVTTWSKFGMRWTGVSVDTLLAEARPVVSATHVLAVSHT